MSFFINKLLSLPRPFKQLIMIFIDSVALIAVLILSFSMREGVWYIPANNFIFWLILISPLIGGLIFSFYGLYRSITRHVGFDALWNIVKAVSLYSFVWGVIYLLGEATSRSVVLINWTLLLFVIISIRMLARWILINDVMVQNYIQNEISRKRILVYGAGNAGIQLVGALTHSYEYNPVGFIDDSNELQGNYIVGLSIYSPDEISNVINRLKVDEVLIAMPSASRKRRFDIIKALEPYPVLVRMLPGVSELAEGKVGVDDMRRVDIKDLLGREPISADKKLLSKNVTNMVLMVTGAGGSIGSEICRQIIPLKPKALILYEVSELALYKIEKELSNIDGHQINIYPALGSVNNKGRLDNVMKHFKVDTIYHTAAYKHVPMVEFNNTEGVDNNVFGTLNCAEIAIANSVETFVLISTDKAVRPTNTMGATKRCAELILQALSEIQTTTKFSMVRFGNVLESSGSVIPLFRKQIREGGPLTVTHKDIYRFFMTISEAVELVIQAGAMGKGGDVFILDMGKPISIDVLAKKMVKLSGLELKDKLNPNGDIEIKYTGLRSGEKLYEELLIGDNASKTKNPLIMRAKEEMIAWEDLKLVLDSLKKEVENCDQEKIRKLLVKIVPGFKPQSKITDILFAKG
ncbi:MAG: polysaccharide biosynthesis protein [Flavobacteriaceae bacterium]|nr:polysaccharide biosynthesis protein [Flavobacteriaceae bacterium]